MPNAIAVFFIIKNSIKIENRQADCQRDRAESREEETKLFEFPHEDFLTWWLAHSHSKFIHMQLGRNQPALGNQR
jgi:hypothetical protein